MNTLIDLRPGISSLLIIPRSMCVNVFAGLGHFAQHNPLMVLDGGNQFNAYVVSRAVRGSVETLDRIRITRAFTCYQVVAMLESQSVSSTSIVCLDFLSTFFDESLPVHERQRLLEACLPHFARLSKMAGVLIVVLQPKLLLPETTAFLDILEGAAGNVMYAELPAPSPKPMRLF